MSNLKIEMDIDPTAKFEMEELAIRGGQAERYEPKTATEAERQEALSLIPADTIIESSKEELDALVERVRAQQQIDVHGMVKRYFQSITLPALWAVATDHYIAKQTKHLARKRIGRNYKRKAYA